MLKCGFRGRRRQVQCFAGLEVPISISWQVKDFVDVEVQIDR